MTSRVTNKDIEQYYNESQVLYNLFWSREGSMHYGFWNKNTKNIKEALSNTDRFLIKHLNINKKDNVLDAGCGIGTSSIFIAENTNAKITGITLSSVQINNAKENAKKTKVKNLLNFSKQDYSKTNFKKTLSQKSLVLKVYVIPIITWIFLKKHLEY